MRKTKQREVIVEELTRLRTHPSADELYAIVKKRLPRISLGTVYRNLDLLSREGVVHRLEVGGSQMRFDGDRVPCPRAASRVSRHLPRVPEERGVRRG